MVDHETASALHEIIADLTVILDRLDFYDQPVAAVHVQTAIDAIRSTGDQYEPEYSPA